MCSLRRKGTDARSPVHSRSFGGNLQLSDDYVRTDFRLCTLRCIYRCTDQKNGFCNERKNESVYIVKEGLNIIPELNIAVLITRDKNEVFSSNVYNFSIQADISSAIINKDLFIRTRRDGDKYFYGGMTRKVKRLLSDRKISQKERDSIPILCDDKGIIMVAGFPVRDDGVREKNESLWVKIYNKLS